MTETSTRVALVTGGSRGIGRAVALELAARGMAVAVAARDEARLTAVRDEITAAGGRALAVVIDVTDEGAVERALAAVRTGLGAPEVLVNDAGVASSAPFAKLTLDLWEETFAVNARGPFLVTRACLPAMLAAGWGRVVNVASTAALTGYPYVAHYAASKHALLGMTRALATELVGKGVTVNCVCPGFVDTEMTARSADRVARSTGMDAAAAREALAKQNRQGRLIAPEEVAAAVAYLAGEEAGAVTGQALEI